MALNYSTTRRLDFHYAPLQVGVRIVVGGTVGDRQEYDASAGAYVPDYASTPLELSAEVAAFASDGYKVPPDLSPHIANGTWSVIECGAKSACGAPDYIPDGASLAVKRNVLPSQPVTIVFEGTLVDPRGGNRYPLYATYALRSKASRQPEPVLIVDYPPASRYNPLRDEPSGTHALTLIPARLIMPGGASVAAANRLFVWEKQRGDGTWSEVGSDVLDYDAWVSPDTAVLTLDRTAMGAEAHVRVRYRYDAGGNPSAAAICDPSLAKAIVVRRVLPDMRFDQLQHPGCVPSGLSATAVKALVKDSIGPVPDPDREISFKWLTAPNTSGLAAYTQRATGSSALIPTSDIDAKEGALVRMDAADRGPWLAWQDADGKLLADADGKILLIR